MLLMELEQAKLDLLLDIERAINEALVLCFCDRKKLSPDSDNKQVLAKREKILKICKKWKLNADEFIDLKSVEGAQKIDK